MENWEQRTKGVTPSAAAQPSTPAAVALSKAFAQSAPPTKTNGDPAETTSASVKAKASVAVAIDTPPLPPRSLNTGVSGKAGEERQAVSEEEELRRREELEIKRAMELSLAEPTQGKELDDLNLSAEELQFVMGSMGSEGSAKEEPEQSLTAAKAAVLPKVVKGAQVSESSSHVMSQQAPRPWVSVKKPKKPEEEEDTAKNGIPEELASSPTATETMGESAPECAPLRRKNTAANYYKALSSMGSEPLESMGAEPTAPLESMGDEPAVPESMGQHDEVPYMAMPLLPPLDDIRREKLLTSQRRPLERQLSSPFPLSPELQYLQVRDSPLISSQSVPRTPSPPNASTTPGGSSLRPGAQSGPYQTPASYKPSTTYVPQVGKHKNRFSGSFVPSPTPSLSNDPALKSQLADQKAYQLAYQKSINQQSDGYHHSRTEQQYEESSHSQKPALSPYSAEYQRQQLKEQKQLQDFYFTPQEQTFNQRQYQQYQQQNQGTAHPPRTAWNWGLPVFNPEADSRYKEEHYGDDGGPSPTPSHISLIPVTEGASPNMSYQGAISNDDHAHAYKVEL